jgi:outer membrane immunogenic protein
MKAIFVAIILSVVGLGRAVAADVDLPAPLPPHAPANYYPATAPLNWGGVYFGINGGYGFGTSNWTNPNIGGLTGGFGTNGFLLGGTAGLNYAIGSGFVFGFEGDIDWSKLSGSSSIAACAGVQLQFAGVACSTKSNWLSTARVRAGYAFDRILIFATAGGAIGDLQMALTPATGFIGGAAQFGWTAGGGIEYAFADNVTAKVEYLYVNLGTASCVTINCGAVVGVPNTGASVSLTENLVRAGVNYKFSW